MTQFYWMNPPLQFSLENDSISFRTSPHTDFWQGTYYGYRYDSGHCCLKDVTGDFTLSLHAQFSYGYRYDQCGIFVYADSENWCKGAVELEDDETARLGSVVTSFGWSDWATTDIPGDTSQMYYRMHRRGSDFLLEQSCDGKDYRQLRMFHFHNAKGTIAAGMFACSPLDSSFSVRFSKIEYSACMLKEE